jgi:hypothetical protein
MTKNTGKGIKNVLFTFILCFVLSASVLNFGYNMGVVNATESAETKKCTVSSETARIRKGASTNDDIVATANRGMSLTITGETNGSDGNVWYQVSFTYNNKEITGFIRSDLVTFDDIPADTAVSEITGEVGGETSTEVQTEETVEPQQEDTTQSDGSSQDIILMNVDSTPYIMPEFTQVSLSWNDQSINAYRNGGFYIFYAQMQNGDEGWYMFDSEKGVYQRYVYDSENATVPSSTGVASLLPVIILAVIIVILIAVVVILALKLRDASYEDDYYGDDDDDYGDDGDDLEFEELDRRPVRRPQQPTQGQRQGQSQQVRRPQQPTQGQSQQARRPQQPTQGQRQGQSQQVRRPQQSGQGQQVRRTQQPGQGQSQQARRPQQSGQGQNPQQRQRRPQNENASASGNRPVNNRPANNDQDDDINLIDV